jgi:GntR family transcriptional regulator
VGEVMTPERARPTVRKHVQVREYVRGLIEGAEPGSPAPSERELVQHFGVARMTVRQALDALVSEGLLERVPGRGTFVARAKADVLVRGGGGGGPVGGAFGCPPPRPTSWCGSAATPRRWAGAA